MDNKVHAPDASRPEKLTLGDTPQSDTSEREIGRARCANCGEVFRLDQGRIINRYYCEICRAVPPRRGLALENKEFCFICQQRLWGRFLCAYCEAVVLGSPGSGLK